MGSGPEFRKNPEKSQACTIIVGQPQILARCQTKDKHFCLSNCFYEYAFESRCIYQPTCVINERKLETKITEKKEGKSMPLHRF